jgi:hypothetical protein
MKSQRTIEFMEQNTQYGFGIIILNLQQVAGKKKLTIFQLFGMKQYFVGFTFHIAVV